MNKIKYLLSFTLIATSITGGPAWAQGAANYPTKAVRFIAPFPPGGSTDLLARLVAMELPEIATIVRQVTKRDGRVYLDYVQNGHGRLLAAPFSVRPVPGALVSTPLD